MRHFKGVMLKINIKLSKVFVESSFSCRRIRI